MDRLSTILPGVLAQRGLRAHADAALVLFRAKEWITERFPEFKNAVTPRALQEDGTLLIECSHPSAARECLAALPHLKVFLREECGFVPVRNIRLIRSRSPAK